MEDQTRQTSLMQHQLETLSHADIQTVGTPQIVQERSEEDAAFISRLQQENEVLHHQIQHLFDVLPSSTILVDKEGTVTHWNKKAEELIRMSSDDVIGTRVMSLAVLGKERIRDGIQRCQQEKKPIMIKSISLKISGGGLSVTDVMCIPQISTSGEPKGATLILSNLSEVAELETELSRKQEELDALTNRFQDMNVKMKTLLLEKTSLQSELNMLRHDFESKVENVAVHVNADLAEKQKELTVLQDSLTSKMNELQTVSMKVDEQKSLLSSVNSELDKRQKELETSNRMFAPPSDAWKENLKICDEIDKVLNTSEEGLKTKKLKDSQEEHTA